MKSFLIVFGFMGFLIYFGSDAHACNCVPWKPKKSYEMSYSVIKGKVISVSPGSNSVKIKTLKTWKNKVPDEISLPQSMVRLCPPHFKEGEIYLLYLTKKNDKLSHLSCMGGSMGLVEKIIQWLNENGKKI